jgi:NADH:ubiquinone oxidoreductase subunit 4 (subunit M)
MQKVFLGPEAKLHHDLPDLSIREKLILIPMTIAIIVLGLFPQFVLNTSKEPVKSAIQTTVIQPVSEIQHDQMKGDAHE